MSLGGIMVSRSNGSVEYVQLLSAIHVANSLIAGAGRVMIILGTVKLSRTDRREAEYGA